MRRKKVKFVKGHPLSLVNLSTNQRHLINKMIKKSMMLNWRDDCKLRKIWRLRLKKNMSDVGSEDAAGSVGKLSNKEFSNLTRN
jgi:hypothetical protein